MTNIDTSSLTSSAGTDLTSLISSSSSSSELTEDDLQEYLDDLESDGNGNSEIARKIKQAINIGSTSSLTGTQIDKAIKELEEKAAEAEEADASPQDPSTVTKEQVTPPVDISV